MGHNSTKIYKFWMHHRLLKKRKQNFIVLKRTWRILKQTINSGLKWAEIVKKYIQRQWKREICLFVADKSFLYCYLKKKLVHAYSNFKMNNWYKWLFTKVSHSSILPLFLHRRQNEMQFYERVTYKLILLTYKILDNVCLFIVC